MHVILILLPYYFITKVIFTNKIVKIQAILHVSCSDDGTIADELEAFGKDDETIFV